MAQTYDTIVIGAGPAGASAALYTARAGWRTLVLDQAATAGALGIMDKITEFPGVGDKPSGEALVKRMRWQARDAGAELREGTVTSAALGASGKLLFCQSPKGDQKYQARTVILATGCTPPTDHLAPGEAELFGRGVSYSVVRDLGVAAKQSVAVFGKGDDAAKGALALARVARQVTFIIPGNRLDAADALQEQLKKQDNIQPLFSASLKEIRGGQAVTEIAVLASGQEKIVAAVGIWLFHHGPAANTGYLAGTVDLAPAGHVLVDEHLTTSIPGVFACGDVLIGEPQIPVIASAQGVMAALNTDRYLRENV